MAGLHAEEVSQAATIRALSGVRGGLVVQLGCGDGQLTAQLRFGPSFIVHGLDTEWPTLSADEAGSRVLSCTVLFQWTCMTACICPI